MNQYLPDTTVLTGFLRQRQPFNDVVRPLLARGEIVGSAVVYAEVIEYLKSLPNFRAHYRQLRRLLAGMPVHGITFAVGERYADLRRQLRPLYGPGLIGDIDTLIAATAIERQLVLITTDGDFQRVPGLQVMLLARKG